MNKYSSRGFISNKNITPVSGIEREQNKTSYASSSTYMYFMVALRHLGWHTPKDL